jgi:hypothetical protein
MRDIPLEDRPTLKDAGLDFQRFGYFTRPLADLSAPQAPSTVDEHWAQLEALISRLKSGDFSAAEATVRLCRETKIWNVKYAATRVLGHAGTVECFKQMREELEQHPMRQQEDIDVESCELVLVYCRAFALWGRLDVVPVLMDQYLTLRLKRTPEISLLPLLMADLLVDDESSMIAHEPPEDLLEDYLNLVMSQYDALVEKHGSDKVIVFRGAPYSVPAIAERMRHLTTRYPSVELATLRERFEPATGIDCSGIFSEKSASPLAAASIAEAFLDSNERKTFEHGQRYFFGHLIPQ